MIVESVQEKLSERKKSKPYVLEQDKKSGAIYLKRERHPLFVELPYLSVFVLSTALAFFAYWQYITLRTDIEFRLNHVQQLEQQLLILQNDNKQLKKIVTSSTDLDYIYSTALNMGMVPVKRENIIYYDKKDHEFVSQNENVPMKIAKAGTGTIGFLQK